MKKKERIAALEDQFAALERDFADLQREVTFLMLQVVGLKQNRQTSSDSTAPAALSDA